MSFSEAIGQVDQILQWEQQVGPLTQDSSLDASTSSASTSSAGTSSATSSFAAALSQAQSGLSELAVLDPGTAGSAVSASDPSSELSALGLTSGGAGLTAGDSELLGGGDSELLTALSSLSGTSANATSDLAGISATVPTTAAGPAASGPVTNPATSPADPRIQAMVQEANGLIGKPYVWGGGHGGWGPQSGYDCSGFVSAVLHAGGYLTSPQDTTTLPSAPGIESGPGQYVTIYDRDAPGEEGHVIIEIDGQFYESGGEHGSWGGGGGVERIATPSAAYLATFNQVLHPAGL